MNDREPEMIIGGVYLNRAQAMTMRVALDSFAIGLDRDGLGSDETGENITKGYLRCIGEIKEFMKRDLGR